MAQSKKLSLIESVVNTLIGMLFSFVVSPLVYWLSDVEMSYYQMGLATVWFTIISIIRGYIIRRWFNKKEKNECDVK